MCYIEEPINLIHPQTVFMIEAPSPLTGNLVRDATVTYSTQQLTKDWGSIYDIDISDEFLGIDRIFKYECPDSGLKFFSPTNAMGGENLYQSISKFPWYYADVKWEYTKCLESIAPNQSLLEIGCGDGHFLSLAEANGHHAFGIDINSKAIQYAGDKGLEVQCCDIAEHARTSDNKYDCVCSFQVLEHLIDVKSFLESATRLLKPGGRLILATPNADSFLRYQYNLLDLPPHHMTQWNRNAYKFLEELLPIRMVCIFNEPLAGIHFEGFATSTSTYISKRYFFGFKPIRKLAFAALKMAQSIGLRRFFKGQCMMAVFEKEATSVEHTPKTKPTPRFANIGCGATLHKDWENFDMAPISSNVRSIDIRREWSLDALSYDFIYSSHVLEHLQRPEARSFLVNCYNSLKPGGILRIVVPDLEGICREYINQLDAARSGQVNAERKHQWMTLELLDQIVRTQSGGIMGQLWNSGSLPESEFIIERLGPEAAKHLQQSDNRQPAPSYEFLYGQQDEQRSESIQQFRNTGEIHQWMYDELSLSALFASIGFVSIKRQRGDCSLMNEFSKYQLDTDKGGSPRKPDSLYMECTRPPIN